MSKAHPAPRGVWIALIAAFAASATLMLWLGRETTLSVDELSMFLSSPGLDVEFLFEPHNGHLVPGSRLVYKAAFEAFGAEYLTFRILTVVGVLVLASLLFVYMRRRVGEAVALAPTLVLLFFGAGFPHLLQGNGFGITVPLSAGIGALLALERRDIRGDLAACALLLLGLAFYTTALAFVVGVAVTLWLSGDRRRLWIAGVPAVLYGIWLLSTLGGSGDAGDQVTISNLLLAPAWGFQALSAILGALTGLDYNFGDPGLDAHAGPVLALVAIAALAWRLRDPGRVPPSLWGTLAILATLWLLGSLVSGEGRNPDSTRYMLSATAIFLIAASTAAAGLRWTRPAIIAIYAVAAMGVGVNAVLLGDGGSSLRDGHTVDVRSALGGLDLAGDAADPAFDPNLEPDPVSPLRQSVVRYILGGDEATGRYLEAADRYGELGYSVEEVRDLDETARIRTDAFLAGALGVALRSAPAPGARNCEVIEAEAGAPITATLPPEGALLSARAASGPVHLQRFADTPSVPVGTLNAGRTAELAIPTDAVPDPWVLSMPGAALTICPLS